MPGVGVGLGVGAGIGVVGVGMGARALGRASGWSSARVVGTGVRMGGAAGRVRTRNDVSTSERRWLHLLNGDGSTSSRIFHTPHLPVLLSTSRVVV